MIDLEVKKVFEKINFIERYKSMSERFQFNLNESFDDFDHDVVLNIINELGYSANFNKKENFFKIAENKSEDQFKFNISLKYGVLEFLWSAWKNNELRIGGSWGMIKEQLDSQENAKVKKPMFCNYDELKEILAEAFLMYEDFKREFMTI